VQVCAGVHLSLLHCGNIVVVVVVIAEVLELLLLLLLA